MNEDYLTERTIEAFREVMSHCETWRNSLRGNAGRPDVVLNWNMATSWWEVKFWNDKPFKSYAQQEVKCRQLARQAHCHYIVYDLLKGDRLTYIVRPDDIKHWRERPLVFTVGFNYNWVAKWAAGLHGMGIF